MYTFEDHGVGRKLRDLVYGVLIVEDDAYFYMQHRADAPSAPLPALGGLGPSFVSIDDQVAV